MKKSKEEENDYGDDMDPDEEVEENLSDEKYSGNDNDDAESKEDKSQE